MDNRGIREGYYEYFYMVSVENFKGLAFSNKTSPNRPFSATNPALTQIIGRNSNAGQSMENQVVRLFYYFGTIVYVLEENTVGQKRSSLNPPLSTIQFSTNIRSLNVKNSIGKISWENQVQPFSSFRYHNFCFGFTKRDVQ